MLAESQGLGGVETLLRNPDGTLHLRITGTPSAFTRTLTGAETTDEAQVIPLTRADAIAWGKKYQCWEGR